jgi:hypothetical protein
MNFSKLDTKTRKSVNKIICHIPTYHNEIPLQFISEILKANGLVLLQEDNTKWSGFLCGESATVSFDLGWLCSNECAPYTDYRKTFEKIENACLRLQWYKMPSGRYEINAYIS